MENFPTKQTKCTACRLLACFLGSINGFLQQKFRSRTSLVHVVLNHHFGIPPSSITLLHLKKIRGASNVCLDWNFVRLLFKFFNKFYLLTNIYITCSGVCAFNWCCLSYSTCYTPFGRQRIGIVLSNFTFLISQSFTFWNLLNLCLKPFWYHQIVKLSVFVRLCAVIMADRYDNKPIPIH